MIKLKTILPSFTACQLAWTTFVFLLYGYWLFIFDQSSIEKRQVGIKTWARRIIKQTGLNIEQYGIENEPKNLGPCIYISNHSSHMDIPILLAYLPDQVCFLAKAELGKIPLFGRIMRQLGFILVDRKQITRGAHALRIAEKKLAEGKSIWLSPQGTRQQDLHTSCWKKGAFLLASRTGVSIVPIYLANTATVWPKGSLHIKKNQHCSIYFGPSISSQGQTATQLFQLCQEAMEILAKKSADCFLGK